MALRKNDYCLDNSNYAPGATLEWYPCHKMGGNQLWTFKTQVWEIKNITVFFIESSVFFLILIIQAESYVVGSMKRRLKVLRNLKCFVICNCNNILQTKELIHVPSNNCLDARGLKAKDLVKLNPCDGSLGQQWEFSKVSLPLLLVVRLSCGAA